MGKYRTTLVEPKKKKPGQVIRTPALTAHYTAIEDGLSVRPDTQFSPECFTNESF